jgi:hypothetical protein
MTTLKRPLHSPLSHNQREANKGRALVHMPISLLGCSDCFNRAVP